MRETPANLKLMQEYDVFGIGKRIIDLLREESVQLKDFADMVERSTYRPFGNIRRFLTGKMISTYDKEGKKDGQLYEKLGSFFLNFAQDAYVVSILLKTDPIYLAFDHAYKTGRIYKIDKEKAERNEPAFLRQIIDGIRPEDIADRIEHMRRVNHLNVRETAARTKVSLATYVKYENATAEAPQRFSFPVLYQLCKTLDVHPDYIMLGNPLASLYQPHNPEMDILFGLNQYGDFTYPRFKLKDLDIAFEEEYGRHIWEDEEEPDEDDSVYPNVDYLSNEQLRIIDGGMNEFLLEHDHIPQAGWERVDYVKDFMVAYKAQYEQTAEYIFKPLTRHLWEYEWVKKNIDCFTAEDLTGLREEMERHWGFASPVDSSSRSGPERPESISIKQARENGEWLMEKITNASGELISIIYTVMAFLHVELIEP